MAFTIPPHAPVAVAKAYSTFERLADEYDQLKRQIADATEQGKRAFAEATNAAAKARVRGERIKIDPKAVRAEGEAKLAALEAEKGPLYLALDLAGDELADKIAECRDEWIDLTGPNIEDAEARYSRALAEAQAALAELGAARRTGEWVKSFSAAEARVGRAQQFVSGRIRIEIARHDLPQDSEVDPAVLLKLAARATEPPVERKPRRVTALNHRAEPRFPMVQ